MPPWKTKTSGARRHLVRELEIELVLPQPGPCLDHRRVAERVEVVGQGARRELVEPTRHIVERRHQQGFPVITKEGILLVVGGDGPPVEIADGRGQIVVPHRPHGADRPTHEPDRCARESVLERLEDLDADILFAAANVVLHDQASS